MSGPEGAGLGAGAGAGPGAEAAAAAAAAGAAAGATEAALGLGLGGADLSLVEMTEVEYTQLQHILYSHLEADGGELEARLGSAFGAAAAAAAGPGGAPVYPLLCPPDGGFAGAAPCLGHIDFQELRMMLLSEASAGAAPGAPTPAPAPAAPADKAGLDKESHAAAGTDEARAKPAVRVRLEDRFNSAAAAAAAAAEPAPNPAPSSSSSSSSSASSGPGTVVVAPGPAQAQATRASAGDASESGVALNNLVTLIRHPSELMNVPLHQQQNKCTTLVKNKTAAAATALQFTYPLFTTNACSTSGNSSLAQAQSSSNSCSVLEATKHQDLSLPRAFSFCYQQEIESTKQTLGSRSKALPEQVWIKVGEEALCKQAISKRNRSRLRQLDAAVERRTLGEIQNVGEGTSAQGPWQAAESSQGALGEQGQSGPPGGRSQRRERHNRMERDRRRRIRICCDELNLLVPFCNAETDKATTLQWTTAFLKYIQERHGDALKKEFESVFCGKTGRRLKLTRPDSLVTCPTQENLQSSPSMEIK